MMQPSGIASALPGQGVVGTAPGQAMPGQLPFNVPKSSGIDPTNVTARLKGMPLGQLSALFAQAQQSRDPMVQAQLLPIAAALSDAAKAAQMQQAAAGQGAMQQAAQMQQQPPVVAQIAQQAAQMQQGQGEPEQGYAGGGLTTTLPYWREGQRFGIDFSPYDSEEERTEKKARLEQMLAFEKSMRENRAEIPVDTRVVAPLTPEAQTIVSNAVPYRGARSGVAQPSPQTSPVPRAAPTGVVTPRPVPRQTPNVPPTPAAQPLPGPTYSDTQGLTALIEAQANELEKRKQTPESILAGRKGLDELMRKRIAEEEAYAKKFGEESLAERDAALKETQGFTPRLLAAMSAGIRPEKGQVMSSLMGGFSRGIEQQAKEAKEAKAAYKQDQRAEQQMRSAIGQMQVLEAQRQQAILERDFERASAIGDQILQLRTKLEEFKIGRSDKAEEQRLAREKEAREQEELTAKKPLYKAQAEQARAYGAAAGARNDVGGDKQTLAELKSLQQNLQKQYETSYGEDRKKTKTLLDEVNQRIAAMSGLDLGTTAPTASGPIYAFNPQTKERIMSVDGGKTWTKAQ